ncbi:MAG: undecaprenyl diphosphate synthase family protein [Methanolinea sp.]|nr:undecaprenyl diphosphate synthase family protein [Methanolinea sp.]
MIRWLYERHLLSGLQILPSRICFMITGQEQREAPGKILEVTRWCIEVSDLLRERQGKGAVTGRDAGIQGVTFHVSTRNPGEILPLLPGIRELSRFARLSLHWEGGTEVAGEGMDVHVAIGKSGREEIAECIRRIAAEGIPSEEVTEQTIEDHLTYPYAPDLVIKTGGSHLTDFLIWQSVYSELFFSDVNWPLFRKTDFLRALRDYQSRVRRFGR